MNNKKYIGKVLEFKIDRKLGSKHYEYGLVYPVNYEFMPNTISGDGNE